MAAEVAKKQPDQEQQELLESLLSDLDKPGPSGSAS